MREALMRDLQSQIDVHECMLLFCIILPPLVSRRVVHYPRGEVLHLEHVQSMCSESSQPFPHPPHLGLLRYTPTEIFISVSPKLGRLCASRAQLQEHMHFGHWPPCNSCSMSVVKSLEMNGESFGTAVQGVMAERFT